MCSRTIEGVVKVFTYKDITGVNQIGGIVPDEPLFAEHEVDFCGMPVLLLLLKPMKIASAAVKKIKVEIEPLPIITDPREAYAKGELIVPPRQFKLGNTQTTWQQCEHVFEGVADTNGQEHLYIETQGAYAIPQENGFIKIYSSTQSPRATQAACCKVTGLAMHQVRSRCNSLGGGFGVKKTRQMHGLLCVLWLLII